MLWANAVGLEKCYRQRRKNREQTEKPITESPLITEGTVG